MMIQIPLCFVFSDRNVLLTLFRRMTKMRTIYYATCSLLLLLMLSAPVHLRAQNHFWEALNGPYGAPADAIIRTAAGTLLVGTQSGVFRSEDNGANWSRSEEGVYDEITGLVAHPDGNVVGRLGRGQMAYSTDDGRSWQPVVFDLGRYQIMTFEVGPGGTMYAGALSGFRGDNSGIFRSTDKGVSWDSIGLNGANVAAILADNGGILIAGINGYGDVGYTELLRSTDGGATWTKVADQQDIGYSGFISALAIDSTAAYWLAQSNGLRRSTDKGLTWDSIPSPFLYPERGLFTFAVAPDGRLLVGTTAGPYRSTDNGTTWTAAEGWLKGVNVWNFAFSNGAVFAATDIGVMVSSDGGVTWSEQNNGIPAGVQALDAGGARTIIARTTSSVRFSTDGGSSWQRRIDEANAVAASPGGDFFIGYNFYSNDHGTLHRSTDGGATWTISTPASAVYRLGFNSAGHLFAAMEHQKIHRSTDNGATWISAPISHDSYEILEFAFDSTRAGYAAVYGGVLRTSDNGDSWTPTSITSTVNAITVDPVGTAYVATTDGVYRSTDQGTTWSKVSASDFTSIVAAGVDELLAAPSELGLYRSTDGGATWNSASAGLPDLVTSLARNRSGEIYAATENYGIYRWTEGSLSVPQGHRQSTGLEVRATSDGAAISVTTAGRSNVIVSVVNGLGQNVGTLFSGELTSGEHRFFWDAGGNPSGVYFISVCGNDGCTTRAVGLTR
jgi:photosystem II stability/assembly factor-like uncharacterized protein